jgi:hypothetical protein
MFDILQFGIDILLLVGLVLSFRNSKTRPVVTHNTEQTNKYPEGSPRQIAYENRLKKLNGG